MKWQSLLVLMAAIVLVAFLGCKKGGMPAGNKSITLQLNWTPDPTFTGAYIAADKSRNFWSQEGLSVDIRAGGFGIDPIAPIVSRQAEFAIVGADKAAVAFQNGAPIRVVGVEFQRNPVGWMVRRSKNVNSMRDLVGRNDVVLGDKIGTETTGILNLMLRKLSIDNKVKPQGVGFDLAFFLQNEDVVYPVYLNEEPVTASMKGIDVVEIDPAEDKNGGLRLYGNVIIAHKDFVAENEQTVRSFLIGLRRGWQFAQKDPKEAERILRGYKEFNNDAMPKVLQRSVSFATSSYGTDVPPGHMEVGQWENTLQLLKEGGVLKKPVSVSELVWFGGIQ